MKSELEKVKKSVPYSLTATLDEIVDKENEKEAGVSPDTDDFPFWIGIIPPLISSFFIASTAFVSILYAYLKPGKNSIN